jgi:hypothetical protein
LRFYGWVRWLLRALFIAVVLIAVATLILFTAYEKLANRQTAVLSAPPSLKEAASKFYAEPDVSEDDVAGFAFYVLQLLHQITPAGSPWLPLLLGSVGHDIYDRANDRVHFQGRSIATVGLTQSLVIERVTGLVRDPASGRISCYVSGYFNDRREDGQQVPYVPYFAQMLLEPNIPSRLNSQRFFLLKLDEYYGAEALARAKAAAESPQQHADDQTAR